MVEKKRIGEVFSYFSKIGVAAIRLTDGELNVGDVISVEGHTTNFTQEVGSMQMDHGPVEHASKGDEVGIKVKEKSREQDAVYKVI